MKKQTLSSDCGRDYVPKAQWEEAKKAEQKALGLYLELQESAQASNRYAQGQLESANKRVERLTVSAKALIEKMEAIHANTRYQGVWTMAQVHGYNYDGPNYSTEFEALKQQLAAEALENDEKA